MVALENQQGVNRTIEQGVWSELLDMARSEGWLDTYNLWNPQGQTVPAAGARSLADALE
jgi:hypothetical protein